ncbi:MAG: type II toxin-antitoxin system PemK/MazF family toxin [Ruminococcaceae bacterium]|nr:type II toxin-antitoxin system PemK/MazF family toxin [Oscillospiraceae bacterium]MBE7008203.1 type II toxin-antitoxin system PemK/MazF family toxin [Oscillospiraceae bacterium]
MNERHILRGDVYYADLRPTIGSEQDGVRPVLVIQNNIGNLHSPTVIVASITSRQTKSHLPTHVNVGRVRGMNSRSIIMLEQVRTIDKARLLDFVGHLLPGAMRQVDRAVAVSMGCDDPKIIG